MALPSWAVRPGPTFEHGDNYSPHEVVWTATDTAEVFVQTPEGYVDVGEAIFPDPPPVREIVLRKATRLELVLFSSAAAFVGAVGGMVGAHVWHP